MTTSDENDGVIKILRTHAEVAQRLALEAQAKGLTALSAEHAKSARIFTAALQKHLPPPPDPDTGAEFVLEEFLATYRTRGFVAAGQPDAMLTIAMVHEILRLRAALAGAPSHV